jgi:hypothetical protein
LATLAGIANVDPHVELGPELTAFVLNRADNSDFFVAPAGPSSIPVNVRGPAAGACGNGWKSALWRCIFRARQAPRGARLYIGAHPGLWSGIRSAAK